MTTTFKKPTNVRYVDMAIYIDSHIYTEDYDPTTIYEYLYHLIMMLAYKAKYYRKFEYYDSFALYGATTIYLRLTNPKQFQTDNTGNPVMRKVTSCLNYIKSCIYPLKVAYEQSEYYQNHLKYNKNDIPYNYSFSESLIDSVDYIALTDFESYLHDVPRTIRAFMNTIPYKQNSQIWNNIYISCLLNVLNVLTLTKKQQDLLKRYGKKIYSDTSLIDTLYRTQRKQTILLFELPKDYTDYIKLLLGRIWKILSTDLAQILKTDITAHGNVRDLVIDACKDDIGALNDEHFP